MKIAVLAVLCLAALARAQIPSLGFCPEYLPMTGFDMERFAGIWYEAERYFQLSEVASRCVKSNYTRGPDGKFRVLNEVTSIFSTGIKRVVEGEIRKAPSKAEEGRLHVKYTSVPLIPLETQYNVLETDYKNYAVLWSCSGVGPVNTQNAWIMTRKRIASGEILQKAYAVLDKYKISKLFFMKTNQEDCAYLDSLEAEQNVRPQADSPQKADSSESSEEIDEAPQPLRAAAQQPNAKSNVYVSGAPQEAVAPAAAAAESPAAEVKAVNVQEQVVNAVKNAASAVKKAAAAIKEAAISKPVEKIVKPAAAPVVAAEPAADKVEQAAAPVPEIGAEEVKSAPEMITKIADKSEEAAAELPAVQTEAAAAAAPEKVEEKSAPGVIPQQQEEQAKVAAAVPIVEEVPVVAAATGAVPSEVADKKPEEINISSQSSSSSS